MPRSLLRATSLLAAALLISGCLSVQTRQRRNADGGTATGGIALHVYADDTAKKASRPGPRGLFIELERKSGKAYEPVFRSLEPAWSVMGLPPGEYRLRFPSRLDEGGVPVPLEEKPRTVRVRAGEVTEVDAVLEHVDEGLVVVGVIAAVAAAVLLHEWLDDHDLPLPPLPPLAPAAMVDAIFWVSLDLATGPDETWAPAPGSRPPVVTSHFPEEHALVAARSVNVTFALSEPLLAEVVDRECIELVGESSGLVTGSAFYDPDRWWIVWEPEVTCRATRGSAPRSTPTAPATSRAWRSRRTRASSSAPASSERRARQKFDQKLAVPGSNPSEKTVTTFEKQ